MNDNDRAASLIDIFHCSIHSRDDDYCHKVPEMTLADNYMAAVRVILNIPTISSRPEGFWVYRSHVDWHEWTAVIAHGYKDYKGMGSTIGLAATEALAKYVTENPNWNKY